MTSHLREEIATYHADNTDTLAQFRGRITGYEAHLAAFYGSSDPQLANAILERADTPAAIEIAADAAHLLMHIFGGDSFIKGLDIGALHPEIRDGLFSLLLALRAGGYTIHLDDWLVDAYAAAEQHKARKDQRWAEIDQRMKEARESANSVDVQ
jgi:hypothetical protein